MKLTYKPLDIENSEEIRSLAKWDNDDEIYHLIIPIKSESNKDITTYESLLKRYQEIPECAQGIFIFYDGEKPIGNFSLLMNPGHLMNKDQSTAWLGLTIGEKEYWGTGAATQAMNLFEEEAQKNKATRIELGVFEFNERAIKFYLKSGFREIGRYPEFTYWNGRMWDDIRMEKLL